MRAPEPLEPEVVAALEAIDATLHGEPVEPEHAEVAELALILRDERPRPDPAFLAGLDARVGARFEDPTRRRRPRRRAVWGSGAALATTVAAVALLVLTVHPHATAPVRSSAAGGSVSSASSGSSGSSGSSASNGTGEYTTTVSSSGSASAAGAGHASTSSSAAAPGAGHGSASSSAAGHGSTSSSAAAPAAGHGSASTAAPGPAPAPRTGRGRDVTQSARLSLRASAGRIGPVAQEVFDVIGAEGGIVVSSRVVDRAGAAGSADFSLQVPSGRLEAALTRLSALRGAQVVTRADASADITGTVNTAAARLAAAQALRRSLLRQLAAATTASAADALKGQLRANEATIVGDAAALARLHAKVSDSPIALTISSPAPGPVATHRARGFTLHRSLDDAGRVLTVIAGVLLIALAVLVPLSVLVAVATWVWARTLRRRREGALGA